MGWNDPDFLRLAGSYAEGAIFVDGFFQESPHPFVQKFVKEYREQFQQDPNLFSAQAYDAANIILEAIKKGAVTPSGVRAAIADTKEFEAVSGYIFEMKEGEAIKKPFLIQVKKGRLVQVN
jgi:ABC-type branched-subunit amino acid transport system substrate-binding protein